MRYSVLLLFILSLNTGFRLCGQSGHITLNSSAVDEKAKKMQAIVAVYRYSGQPFEDPLLNGIETEEKAKLFNAVLPDLKGSKDTCYAYLYFGGVAGKKDLPGYVMAVLTNNTRNEKPCLIWVDRNFNLDLRDDGAPDTFLFNTRYKDITFANPNVKGATYACRISRFPFNYDPKYLSMLDDYYKTNSGAKVFRGAFYSFKEERLNTRAGDYNNGNDSFRIALKDVNCNGIYNEPGIDQVILGEYKSRILSDNILPIAARQGKNFFERNGKHYDITTIDPFGHFVDITLNLKEEIKNSLVVGKKIKKFKFNTLEKDKKSISVRKYRKKPTYIYVWRMGEPDFEKDTAALREIAMKYADKVNLLTLNYGETPKELLLFKNRNKINWLIGLSRLTINQKLFVEKYPTGILTKKRLKISHVGISAVELLNLLKNNSI